MKRSFDIVLGLVGACIFAPIGAAIALSIFMTAGSPVIFRQARIGKGGKEFVIWKFRTMKQLPGHKLSCYEPGITSRITSFGRFLRKTKLDELPQLWNVLIGEMSLVGPRPEVPEWVSAYPDRWSKVLSIRPGITDPASIIYRGEEIILARVNDPRGIYKERILPDKLKIYEKYLETRSLGGDIRIIAETLFKVIVDALNKGS